MNTYKITEAKSFTARWRSNLTKNSKTDDGIGSNPIRRHFY